MRSLSPEISDEELLTRLAASFPVEQREPDPSSLRQLSLAVAALRQAQAASVPAAHDGGRALRARMPRRLSPAIIAGAVLGAVVTGSGISYAVGVPVPAAVRSVARVVGLAAPAPPATAPNAPPVATTTTPTTSPAVSAARQAESTLDHALTGNPPPPAVISHDSSVLAHRLEQVGGSHTAGSAQAVSNGQHLLYKACRQEQGASPTGNGVPTASGTTCTATGGIVHPPSAPTTSVPLRPSGTSGTSTSTPTATPFGGRPATGMIAPDNGSRPLPDTSPPGSFGGHRSGPSHDQPRK